MKRRICIVTTLWSSISNWIKPFLIPLHEKGIEVTVVCNMDAQYEADLKKEFPFVTTFPVPFPRGISGFGSFKSIWTLFRLFKKEKFDMVQYSTPNASFYASVASWLSGIKIRLYCQWGMVFVTQKGLKRLFLKFLEWTTCHCSTDVQPDSIGNLQFCRSQHFYDEKKSCVIWNGSAKGLDLSKFDISRKTEFAEEIRKRHGLGNSKIIGFVGRLGKEKGCHELIWAFQKLKQHDPDLKMLFIGPIEKLETMDTEVLNYFQSCKDIVKTGRVNDVEKYLAAMDVFILPSYREGFGMSVIEASAMKVPVIATKYPGPGDTLIDGVTGYAISIGNVDEIVSSVEKIFSNSEYALQLGENGRKFVEEKFDQKVFVHKYIENRLNLLGMNK